MYPTIREINFDTIYISNTLIGIFFLYRRKYSIHINFRSEFYFILRY